MANGLARGGVALGLVAAVRSTAGGSEISGLELAAALLGAGLASVALRVWERSDAERLGAAYAGAVRAPLFAALERGAESEPSRRAEVGAESEPSRRAEVGAESESSRRAEVGAKSESSRCAEVAAELELDLSALHGGVADGAARLLVTGASLPVLGVALALLHPPLAFAAAGLCLLFVAAGLALHAPLRAALGRERRARGKLSARLHEGLLALPALRGFRGREREWRRLALRADAAADARSARVRLAALLYELPEAGMAVVCAGLALVAIEAETLAGALVVYGLLLAALRDLAGAWPRAAALRRDRARIEASLAEQPPARAGDAAALPAGVPIALTLHEVGVADALPPVSLRADAGEAVQLTGASGSGKSSLLARIAQGRASDTGEVRLAGRPIQDWSPDSVRQAVQRVSPRVPLLRGTVLANLTLANPDLSDAEAAALCRLCGVPEGWLGRRVDEPGREAPDGLRARIALARALAAKPGLLLVDDPAFATDGEARAALDRVLLAHPVTLVVASRDGLPLVREDRRWSLAAGPSGTAPRQRPARRRLASAPAPVPRSHHRR